MHISRIEVTNFRNVAILDLVLDQGFIVLEGGNGMGKTNFLESIYFGANLRRFPETKLSQLFQEGKDFFRVRLVSQNIEPCSQEIFAENREERYTANYKINNVETGRNEYQSTLPAISFIPQDLNLLTRSPDSRRRYLNETLCLVSAQYRYAHLQYERALRQRNELLNRLSTADKPETLAGDLDIWDEALAEYGSFVTTARAAFIEYSNQHLSKVLAEVSPELTEARFIYRQSGAPNKQAFLEKIKKSTSSPGPHRDDFETYIGGRNAVGFLSRGQIRSTTLALKFLEKQYLAEKLGKTPVVLLDDVFSEFDEAHQQKLSKFLKSFEQVFVTTTHLNEIKRFLPETSQVYNISKGVVARV